MKFSLKTIAVAVAMTLGAGLVPVSAGAQSFGGGEIVAVRDSGHGRHVERRGRHQPRFANRDRDRRDFRHGRRFDERRHYSRRDRFNDSRRYYRNGHRRHDNGVVIRLR